MCSFWIMASLGLSILVLIVLGIAYKATVTAEKALGIDYEEE